MMDASGNSEPIVLTPPRVLIVGNRVAGIYMVAAGAIFTVLGLLGSTVSVWLWFGFALGIAVVLFGTWHLVRSPHFSIVLSQDAATIHDYFGTRRIPRSQIVGLSRYPSLLCVDALGKRRKYPINALSVGNRGLRPARILAPIDERVRVLADWVDKASHS
jgi:hypothetical protein